MYSVCTRYYYVGSTESLPFLFRGTHKCTLARSGGLAVAQATPAQHNGAGHLTIPLCLPLAPTANHKNGPPTGLPLTPPQESHHINNSINNTCRAHHATTHAPNEGSTTQQAGRQGLRPHATRSNQPHTRPRPAPPPPISPPPSTWPPAWRSRLG